MEIGVIGLGHMGSAMALRLIEAAHEVTVWNRTESKARDLLAHGAMLAHSPAGAAQGDIVITMLANDEALEQLVFGTPGDKEDKGLLAHQGKRTIHISMSTVSVELARRVAMASTEQGKSFISAPVMGRPEVAQQGELIVMAAGDPRKIDKCKPAFEAFATSTHVLGDSPEQANITKLAANFMISSMIETFGEAFALLRKNDIDHHKFLQIMGTEFFKSPVYEKYGKIIADESFDGGAFTVKGQEKDTRLALNAAIASQVPMPFLSAIENTFLSAIGRGKGDLDPCAISQVAFENAGLLAAKRK